MEIATKIASVLFAPLLNLIGRLFGSIKLSATVEDVFLREPPKPDGYGGHSGGSRVLFELLIINRKSKPIIIDSLYCQALSEEKTLLSDGIAMTTAIIHYSLERGIIK